MLVAAFVALGALGAWAWGWKLVPPDPDTQAVRMAAKGAIRSLYLDAFPPAAYTGGPLPSADAQAIRDRVTSDIERYFTPLLQARYEPRILAAIDQIGIGAWDSQGDLSIDWDRATINGDQASIGFREHTWLVSEVHPVTCSRHDGPVEGRRLVGLYCWSNPSSRGEYRPCNRIRSEWRSSATWPIRLLRSRRPSRRAPATDG